MSNSTVPGENRGQKSRYLNGGGSLLLRAPLDPDDGQSGEWSREELMQMDADFCAAVERAIAQGLEHRRLAGRCWNEGHRDRQQVVLRRCGAR